MYEELIARIRYHIRKADFMGLREHEGTRLLNEAADAIEELQKQLREEKVDNVNLTGWLAEEYAKNFQHGNKCKYLLSCGYCDRLDRFCNCKDKDKGGADDG